MGKIQIPYIRKIGGIFKRVHPFYLSALGIFVLLAGMIGLGSWYGYTRITEISSQLASLSVYVESLDANLENTASELKEGIEDAQTSFGTELEKEKQNVVSIQEQLGSVGQEIGQISGTVGTLEKLSKTDPELLQKYSKVFFLNEHYEPPRLEEIPDAYEYYEDRHSKVHANVWPYLQTMLDGAKQDGVDLYVYSAFRPFSEQQALKEQYKVVYGEGTANQFSADQGYSEHQIGTTVDLITTGIGGKLEGFETTGAYRWLLDNSYRYGFILSYPENNNFYVFEPWHWRFVGTKLASYLKDQGLNFYDMNQRDIDEYLVSVFD